MATLAAFAAQPLHIVAVVLHPARGAAHNLHSLGKGTQVVAVGCGRIGKLYGYVSRGESIAVEVFLIVNVDYAHNLVAAVQGYLLYHLAHLAVADKCYSHCYNAFILSAKVAKTCNIDV